MGKNSTTIIAIAILAFALLVALMIVPVALGMAIFSNQSGGPAVKCEAAPSGPQGKPYLVGDSIGVGMKDDLKGYTVNAEGGRTLAQGLPVVQKDKNEIANASAVVVELGTNKSPDFEQDAKAMVNKIKSFNSSAQIYWVQIFSKGDYEQENKTISGLNSVTMIQTKNKNIPLADGIHPTPEGYKKLANVISSAVSDNSTASSSGSGGDCGDSGDSSQYSGECKANRIAFIEQPGQSGLTKLFGGPGPGGSGGKQKSVKLLDETVQVHEKVAPCVEAVERERKAKGVNYKVTSGIGGYRYPDGQLGSDSFHEYGAAIDINPETNPYCGNGQVVGNAAYCSKPDMPKELVKIFKSHGFYWGGDFRSVKDYMHFEWHGERP